MRKYLFKYYFGAVLLTALATACQSNQKLGEEKSVQEIKDASKLNNASIIRNPVTADAPDGYRECC